MIWLKCEPWRRCLASETIFHSDENNIDVQTGFRGRVSLLEPDKTQQNCSIIINDLTESDSGSYQFKLVGYSYYGGLDRYSFPEKVTLRVTGLTQRPTLTVPTLMAGQQSTLICTAPGLCSGSDPKITWSWPGNGGNISYSTADETETLTPVTKRYSSALTLNASADNHGNGVICEVSFRGDLKAAQTAVLNVTCVVPEGVTQSVVLPWVIAAVSLLVAGICVICVLIQRRKGSRSREEPSPEDRTYMSLKKSDPSTDYDVIGPRRK